MNKFVNDKSKYVIIMNKRNLLLMLFLMTTTITFAYSFEVDGIYYNAYTNDDGVDCASVTYKEFSSDSHCYSGNITIPGEVTNNGKTYQVTAISQYAFAWCKDLTSVTMPNTKTFTYIGTDAFLQCDALTSLTIPEFVDRIEYDAFNSCINLKSIDVDNENANFCSENGILFNKDKSIIMKVPITYTGTYDIPNSVNSIGSSCFYDCYGLISITIPTTVKEIGDYSFWNCSSLTSIYFPDSLKEIGVSAFQRCTGISSLEIPDSVTMIYDHAFEECRGIKTIKLPNKINVIAYETFKHCSSLKSITLPNSITKINEGAFSECSILDSVIIPKSVDYIDINAFADTPFEKNQPQGLWYINNIAYKYIGDMPKNTSIILKDNTNLIGHSAFEDCTNLSSVTIPATVNYIDHNAFYNCTGLNDIYSYILDPSKINVGFDIFDNVNYSNCNLHIVKGTKSIYQTTYPWIPFFNIIEDLTDTYIENNKQQNTFTYNYNNGKIIIKSEEMLNGIKVYDFNGNLIAISNRTSKTFEIPVNTDKFIIKCADRVIKCYGRR
jgi:hypothetical protein